MSLPVPVSLVGSAFGFGREFASTGKPLLVTVSGGTAQANLLNVADGGYPGGDGAYLAFQIRYEAVE